MEWQKIINLLNNTPNQSTKFRIKSWIEISYNSLEAYDTNSQIKFKTSKLGSNLSDSSDEYIFVSGTLTILAWPAGGGNNNI